MSNYLIGVGGTGAKCMEAVLHLAAAGLMPARDTYALFVDPDSANGSLERAKMTLKHYTFCQENIRAGASALFGNRITLANPDVWSPIDNGVKQTLGSAVGYNDLRNSEPEVANLFDVLYSPKEREADLRVGFRGHPSIGAAILAQTISFGKQEPWATFRSRIKNDTASGREARIFLCGSVFGGTGASGLPNIARLVKQEVASDDDTNARFGCVLVLPYFSFDFGAGIDGELKADASAFIPNTQTALKYYHQRGFASVYDCMYVVGDADMSPVQVPSVGGQEQRNEPHFIELFAGLAAVDFFAGGESEGVAITAPQDRGAITWEDLPYDPKPQLIARLVQVTRFAFAYLSVYEPALRQVDGSNSYALPWYIDFFERGPLNVDVRSPDTKEQLRELKRYARSFLEWMACIHTSADEHRVQLVRWQAFAANGQKETRLRDQFDLSKFGSLGRQHSEDGRKALDRLWRYMCSNPPTGEAEGLGAFIRALYEGCADDIIIGS